MRDSLIVHKFKEEEQPIKEVSYFQFMAFAIPISLNYMIDYFPQTVAYFIFAQKGELETQSVIGFGLTYIIFTYGYSTTIPDLIGLKISNLCEQKQYKSVTDILFKLFLCVLVYVFCSLILSFYSESIMLALSIDPGLASRCSVFIKCMIIPKLIEIILFFFKSLLISQKITSVFMYINIATTANLVISSYVFMYKMDISEIGYFLVILFKNLIEAAFLVYFLSTRCNREYLFIPKIKDMTAEYWPSFVYSIKILIGNYSEWTAAEVNSYLAALTKKAMNIVTWSCSLNFLLINFFFGCGEVAYFRTYGTIAIGEKNFEAFDSIRKKTLRFGLFNHTIVLILIFVFVEPVATFYTSDPATHSLMKNIFRIMSLSLVIDYTTFFHSTSLRMIRQESLQMKIMAVFYPIAIISTATILSIGFGLEVYGLAIAFNLSSFSGSVIMYFLFGKYERKFFEELSPENSKTINEVNDV